MAAAPRPIGRRSLPRPALLFAFALAGVGTTLLGPLLPWLAHRLRLGDPQLGAFFTAQFAASILGVLLCGVLLPRGRFRAATVAGLVLLGGGMAAVTAAHYAGVLAAVAVYGLGLGMIVPAGNLLAAQLAAPDSAAALNLLNFAWAGGAVASPGLVALALRAARPGEIFHAFAAVAALAAVIWLADGTLAARPSGEAPPAAAGPAATRPAWLLLAALFFLYVGSETAMGGWIATLVHRAGVAGRAWLLPAALFWAGLLAGRALAPWPLRRIAATALARGAAVLAVGGIAVLLALPSAAAALLRAHALAPLFDLTAALCGLGFSVVFPVLVSLLSPAGAGAPPPAATAPLLFVPATLGGASLPWLVGILSRHGGLRAALLLPLAGMLAIALLLPAAKRRG